MGDEIEATVVDDGSRSGTIVLKRVAGRGGHVPGELEQAFANGIPVEGLVTGENKGGYDVQLGGVRAFCPGSQIDRRRTEGRTYVGERLRFRITKLEAGGRNVVVSRRQLLEEEAAAQAAATWDACRGRRRHRHRHLAPRLRRVRRPRRRRGPDPRERARPRARDQSGATCWRSASRSRRRS